MAAGETVYNVAKGRKERVGRLLRMHANKREEIQEIYAGDIAAAVGLKTVSTGDTICDDDSPIVLESIEFPTPVIQLAVEPRTKGSGFEFVNDVYGGSIPKEYIAPAEAGMKEALEGGILAGYPMSDLKVSLYDGSYHDVGSSEIAFKIAGSLAIKEAVKRAHPVLLEPIMAVEVVVPEEYMGDVIGDLNSR